MKHNYLTAHEIKEATDVYVKEKDEIKLDDIYNQIAAQVRLGKYSLTIYEQLSKPNKNFLKSQGFEIYEGPSYCCANSYETYAEVLTTISWRNAE